MGEGEAAEIVLDKFQSHQSWIAYCPCRNRNTTESTQRNPLGTTPCISGIEGRHQYRLAILAIALRETISIYIARIRKVNTSLSGQSIGYGKPILLESLEGLGTILIRWRKGRKNHIVRNHKVTCGIAYQRIVITIDGIEGLCEVIYILSVGFQVYL